MDKAASDTRKKLGRYTGGMASRPNPVLTRLSDIRRKVSKDRPGTSEALDSAAQARPEPAAGKTQSSKKIRRRLYNVGLDARGFAPGFAVGQVVIVFLSKMGYIDKLMTKSAGNGFYKNKILKRLPLTES